MEFKTRSKTDIYSNMLTLQAEMAFPFERPFFERKEWTKAKTIFDFGCGNAHYLTILSDLFPEKEYIGCEKDPDMRASAKKKCKNHKNIAIVSPEEATKLKNIDYFIFRLVLLHLPDRNTAYSLTKTIGKRGFHVLIVDADDTSFLARPEPKIFLETLATLRKTSVDRELFSKVDNELERFNLISIFSSTIIINNTFPHSKDLMIKYMYYTAELGIGSPLTSEVTNDLLEWWLDPKSYIQYGIFVKIFKHVNEP